MPPDGTGLPSRGRAAIFRTVGPSANRTAISLSARGQLQGHGHQGRLDNQDQRGHALRPVVHLLDAHGFDMHQERGQLWGARCHISAPWRWTAGVYQPALAERPAWAEYPDSTTSAALARTPPPSASCSQLSRTSRHSHRNLARPVRRHLLYNLFHHHKRCHFPCFLCHIHSLVSSKIKARM